MLVGCIVKTTLVVVKKKLRRICIIPLNIKAVIKLIIWSLAQDKYPAVNNERKTEVEARITAEVEENKKENKTLNEEFKQKINERNIGKVKIGN